MGSFSLQHNQYEIPTMVNVMGILANSRKDRLPSKIST